MWRCSECLRADLRLSGERRVFDAASRDMNSVKARSLRAPEHMTETLAACGFVGDPHPKN
jgi:hypothetical protein